jgi:hypothetical protein
MGAIADDDTVTAGHVSGVLEDSSNILLVSHKCKRAGAKFFSDQQVPVETEWRRVAWRLGGRVRFAQTDELPIFRSRNRVKIRVAGKIGIGIECHVDAAGPRIVNQPQKLGSATPLGRGAHVGVRQVDVHACAPANLDARRIGVKRAVALVSVMRGVVSPEGAKWAT